jgi:hypothetical protein
MIHLARGVMGTILLLFICVAVRSQPSERATVFLLQEPSDRRWCAYGDEARWRVDIERAGALSVATVDYENGRIAEIKITEAAESGDWVVYDSYTFDNRRRTQRLVRTINLLPGNRSHEEVYLFQDGKPVKQSSTSRSLSTGRELPASSVWLPTIPIFVQVEEFPFASIVTESVHNALLKDPVCKNNVDNRFER